MQNDRATTEVARTLMKEMRQLLQEASLIAVAADSCAEHGDLDAAIRIMMNFENPAARAQQISAQYSCSNRLAPRIGDAVDPPSVLRDADCKQPPRHMTGYSRLLRD